MLAQLHIFLFVFCSFSVSFCGRGTTHPLFYFFFLPSFISYQYRRTDVTSALLFSSVILPFICTVFKESFVYVFAIKKEKCDCNRMVRSLSLHMNIMKGSVMQCQRAKAATLPGRLHARVGERVKR